jgi:hypothetical protein
MENLVGLYNRVTSTATRVLCLPPPTLCYNYAFRFSRHSQKATVMSFNLGRAIDCEGRIQRDFIEFARLWADVKQDWLDDRCRKFERDHLSTLGPSLNRFAAAMHDFCDSVRKAEAALKDSRQVSDELQ